MRFFDNKLIRIKDYYNKEIILYTLNNKIPQCKTINEIEIKLTKKICYSDFIFMETSTRACSILFLHISLIQFILNIIIYNLFMIRINLFNDLIDFNFLIYNFNKIETYGYTLLIKQVNKYKRK